MLARAAPSLSPRSLLYALRTGSPSAVVSVVMSNLPIASVARYVACGLLERQLKRVQPSLELCDCSTPLLIAWVPSGTDTDTSYVASQIGLGLLGDPGVAGPPGR
jgi:hypothetical protein